MSSYEQITYEASNRVATVTLNRPEKLNAWTQKMEQEVTAAIQAASADEQVGVIILTGAGKGFCAGADMSLLSAISQEASPRAEFLTDVNVDGNVRADFRKKHAWLLSVPKPILAAINGPAVGLGFIIPLYCDFRFASEKARFSVIFSKRGLVAEYGLAWMQIYTGLLQNLGEAFDLATQEMKASFGTEDFKEGVAHFLEKRAAAFTGR